MSRAYSPAEPARAPDYRRFYTKVKRQLEEISDEVEAIYQLFHKLRIRVDELERKVDK